MAFIVMEASNLHHRMETSFFLYTLMCVMIFLSPTNASCITKRNVAVCSEDFPRISDLTESDLPYSVITKSYTGELRSLPRREGDGVVSSLQVNDGTIKKIMPNFFEIIGNGQLKYIVLNSVQGNYNLDIKTMAGLEQSLENLRVNRHKLSDISGVGTLQALKRLTLVNTQLTKVPENFINIFKSIQRLDLSDNKFQSLPWDVIAQWVQGDQFATLSLKGNPIHCDCSVRPMVEIRLRKK